MEQAGECFIANLDNSSRDNRNSIAYLLKLREINRQKELAFRLIDDQLQQSQLKLKKKKSIFLDEALAAHCKKVERRAIYHGMDAGVRLFRSSCWKSTGTIRNWIPSTTR